MDLADLSFPELTEQRRRVLDALVQLCRTDPDGAAEVLQLPRTLISAVAANAELPSAPTGPAARVYSGVLHSALNLAGMDAAQRRRAHRRVAVVSGLFGLLRPADRIPAYRLSGGVSLPGIGALTAWWREPLSAVIPRTVGDGLLVDMRSSPYTAMWSLPRGAANIAVVKIWQHGPNGGRVAVSHHNKAAKGAAARVLAGSASAARNPAEASEQLAAAGWDVSATPDRGHTRLDITLPSTPPQ